jgi:hypothetical protein
VRCYRVDEDVHVGIPLKETTMGLTIEVGEALYPLSHELSDGLLAAKASVLDQLDKSLLANPELVQLQEMRELLAPESIQLIHADVGQYEIVKETRRQPDALVLVETSAGINGHITFMSTTYDESFDTRSNRVRRKNHRIFPPPGVTVLKEGKTHLGGSCYLLRMVPNSSFRMERTGELDGAPSILTVAWKGRKGPGKGEPLIMFSPSRQE